MVPDPFKAFAKAAAGEESVAKPQSFGQLTIERRVLITPRSTINIMNIASIEVRSWTEKKVPSWLLLFIVSVVGAWVPALAISAALGGRDPSPIVMFVCFFVAGFIAFKMLTKTETFNRLIIASNDGSRTYFPASDIAILEQVRRVLSDKINAHDEQSTFNINFEKGVIESMEIGSIGAVDTLVSGTGNQVAKNGGRIGTQETSISHSPGAVVGSGNVVSGNTYSVNYSSYLPAISDLRQTYSSDSQYDYIVKRLDHLDQLMRTGTPTPDSKSVMRDILKDLAQIFGAIPDAITIFRGIGKLAGFAI